MGIAGAIVAIGLAIHRRGGDPARTAEYLSAATFSIVLGLTFVVIGLIAIAAYGVVRAVEWRSR